MEITVLAPRNFRDLSIWMFPKIVVTQQPWGFPTKNDHFGVVWGYHHFRKHPYTSLKTNILNPTMGGGREDWSSFSTQVIFRFQPLVFRGLYVGSFAELGTSRLLNVIFCWRVFFPLIFEIRHLCKSERCFVFWSRILMQAKHQHQQGDVKL